jgi:hypothetical protein
MTEPIAVDVPGGKPAFPRSAPPSIPSALPAVPAAPKLPEAAKPAVTPPPVGAPGPLPPAPKPGAGVLAGFTQKQLKVGVTALVSVAVGVGVIRLAFPPKDNTPPPATAAKDKDAGDQKVIPNRTDSAPAPTPAPKVHIDTPVPPPPEEDLLKLPPVPVGLHDSTPLKPTRPPAATPTSIAPAYPTATHSMPEPPKAAPGLPSSPDKPEFLPIPPAAHVEAIPPLPDPHLMPIGGVEAPKPPAPGMTTPTPGTTIPPVPATPPAGTAPALPPLPTVPPATGGVVTPPATGAGMSTPAIPQPMELGAPPSIPKPPAGPPATAPAPPEPVISPIPNTTTPTPGVNVPSPRPEMGTTLVPKPPAPDAFVPTPMPKPDVPAIPAPGAIGNTPGTLPMIDPTPKPEVKSPAAMGTGTPTTFSKPSGGAEVRPGVPETLPKSSFDVDLHNPTAGDSYESISKEFYNDARFAPALKAFNKNLPLQGGRYVEVPPLHVLKRRFPTQGGNVVPAGSTGAPTSTGPNWGAPSDEPPRPSVAGRGSFTVPAGGLTLQDAARQMGTSWRDLYDLNPQYAPGTLIPAGTELKVPAARP